VTTVVSDIVAAMAAGSLQQTAFPVIVVRSTILPGTIESLAALLESRYHLEVGADFGLAMCPEFLREASAVADFFAPPFTVAGVNDDRSRAVMESLFAFVDAPFHPVAVPTAETIKYACNAFHAMKVAFANEVARFAQATGGHGPTVMDVFCQDHQLNVSEAYLRPGFAFGGSCLPKDLRALVQCGRELGLDLPLLSSVLPSNEQHLDHTLRLILSHGPRRVGLLGLTFKTGTDDLRESPFVRVAETLIGKGIDVSIWDPDLNPVRLRGGNLRFADDRLPHLGRLLEASPVDALAGADLALVGTDHPDAVAALALGPPIPVIDDESSLAAGPAERSHEFARVMS
jgi:GDP-mannose 6-dehydrogenase